MVVRVLLRPRRPRMEELVDALQRAQASTPELPCMVIAHTIKGWGLECMADPANHSRCRSPRRSRRSSLRDGLSLEDPFALFDEATPRRRALPRRARATRSAPGIARTCELREREPRAPARARSRRTAACPRRSTIDLSLFPLAHTQWMWGQLAAKLVRIGSRGRGRATDAAARKRADRPRSGAGRQRPTSC